MQGIAHRVLAFHWGAAPVCLLTRNLRRARPHNRCRGHGSPPLVFHPWAFYFARPRFFTIRARFFQKNWRKVKSTISKFSDLAHDLAEIPEKGEQHGPMSAADIGLTWG